MAHAQESKLVGFKTYIWTYVVLLLLATLSLLLRLLPIHAYVSVALAIGFVKAVLVMANFMHLAHEGFGFKSAMMIATLLVVILIWLTAADPATRAPFPPPPAQNSEFSATAPR